MDIILSGKIFVLVDLQAILYGRQSRDPSPLEFDSLRGRYPYEGADRAELGQKSVKNEGQKSIKSSHRELSNEYTVLAIDLDLFIYFPRGCVRASIFWKLIN